jgi:hypothetical protein
MRISTAARGVERAWNVIVRLRPILKRCSSQRVQTYLLAGLVLTMSLPAQDFPRAACCDNMKVPAESRDSLPDDTEPLEGESSFDEIGLRESAQRRSRLLCAPNGIRTSRLLWPWTLLATFQPRPWWLIRFETGESCTGHFVAEGRALRLWVQSQTC